MNRFPTYFYDLSCGEQYVMLIQTLLAKYKGYTLDQELFDGIVKDYYELMNIYNEDCFFGCLPMDQIEMIPREMRFNGGAKWYVNEFTFSINVKGERMYENDFIKYLESIKEIADVKKKIQKLWT